MINSALHTIIMERMESVHEGESSPEIGSVSRGWRAGGFVGD